MSLTQRAKKKLVGSFSKRKKLKICKESEDKPPPLPRSRPPIPTFITTPLPVGETLGCLHSSVSLPAQLDQSEEVDLVQYSSTSVLTSEIAPFTFSCDSALSSQGGNCHAPIPASESPLPGSVYPRCSSIEEEASIFHVYNSGAACFSSAAHLSYPVRHTRADTRVYLAGLSQPVGLSLPPRSTGAEVCDKTCASSSCRSQDQKLSQFSEVFNPRSSPALDGISGLDGDQLVTSLFSDIIADNANTSSNEEEEVTTAEGSHFRKEGSHLRNEDRILTQDIGIFEEVFQSVHDEVSFTSSHRRESEVDSDSTLDFTLSSDDFGSSDCEQGIRHGKRAADSPNDATPHSHCNNKRKRAKDSLAYHLPQIPRMDSSVLKKIQFFESYCDTNKETNANKNGSLATKINAGNKHSSSDNRDAKPSREHNQAISLAFWTQSAAHSDAGATNSSKEQTLFKPSPMLRVFPNAGVPSPRLNFSRFKRSGSIPEAVAVCGCENSCEGDCRANHIQEADSRLHRGEVTRNEGKVVSRPKDSSHFQVCHHPQCTEENSDHPFILCRQCDLDIHKQPQYSGHLVLDVNRKRQVVGKSPSPTLEYDGESDSDSQHTVTDDQVDGLFVKHNSKLRNKSPNSELERKLKRKKALKKKNSGGSKNDGLEEVLAQLADPENLGSSPAPQMDWDSSDFRSQKDATGRKGSYPGDGPTSGAQRQDSQESAVEGSLDSGHIINRAPVRRQSRVTVPDSHFILKFGGGNGQKEDLEVVAATHNTTLREAIEASLERRKIDPNRVNVFIEKSKTPLPLSSDTSFLAGNTLEIKEKDDKDADSSQGKQRLNSTAKSSSSKGNKQSGGSLRGRIKIGNLSIDDTFYPTSSPQGTWTEGKKNKSPKLSVANLFTPLNKDREKQDQLNEILTRYNTSGLPPLPELLAFGRPKFDDSMCELESHWTMIVTGYHTLTKKQQEHQEAVWELLGTEVSYIRQIRVIIDVFQNCLINVQQESLLNEIETERLFSNIDKVFECNCMFWQQYLLPVLQYGRETRQPLDPLLCKEGFVDHFPNLFQVYFKYFIEHKSCLDYAKSCMENSELFKTFILWAETQKQCNRLKLADILVKPMQRLLKYSLLLQAILKHTEMEENRSDIKEMIQAVDKLCWAANNSLQRREDYEKLEIVRKTIDLYDAIEAPNDECAKIIQEYNGNFNLLAPMPGFRDGQPRSLLFHSSLRMKEGQNVKLDVDCLLFTDLILICKPNKKMDRFKIIRPPMRLDQLVVSELKDKGSFLLIYMNEYHVPISAFTFHSDVGAIRGWLEKFREAQRAFKTKKIEESAEMERLRTSTSVVQEEVEYTPLSSVPSDLDLVSSAFPRSDSMESADRFIPNLLTPADASKNLSQSELGRSGSTSDIQIRPMPLAAVHRELTHASTDTKLSASAAAPFSPLSKHRTSGSSGGGTDATHVVFKHKPVQTCRSVPNIMVNNGTAVPQSGFPSHFKHRNSADNGQGYSIMGGGPESSSLSTSVVNQLKDTHRTSSEVSLLEKNNIPDEEDFTKHKLSARRVSRTEKRYHTADSIQDMKNSEKDSSIHKRLSWRTDIPVVEHRNFGFNVLSADSVQSIPSSSGVSSTGSLHLNLESEISEEGEGNYSVGTGTKTGGDIGLEDRRKLFSVGGINDIDDEDIDEARGLEYKSKSTPDLVTVFDRAVHISDMEDGIASVEVAADGFKRKLTPADILKMRKLKHQILYDANIESSEV